MQHKYSIKQFRQGVAEEKGITVNPKKHPNLRRKAIATYLSYKEAALGPNRTPNLFKQKVRMLKRGGLKKV